MKKERNCMGTPYPIYPMYQPGMMQSGMMSQPGMLQPGMMNQSNMMPQSSDNYNSINNQISNLEKRVARLESIVGNNATYSESNFYMV